MKAIVLSHEAGGSYLLDNTGSYHFAKAFTHMPIGSEVDLEADKRERRVAKCVGLAACTAFVALAVCFIVKRRL